MCPLEQRTRTTLQAPVRRRVVVLLLLGIAFPLFPGNVQSAEPPGDSATPLLTIRVGVQPYADDGILQGEELIRYQQLCSEIADNTRRKYNRPIRIRVAAGSYADLYYWCEHDMIDMAVVTAGVYSLLAEHLGERWTYLCTMGQGASNDRFEFGVECIAAAGVTIKDLGQIQAAFDQGLLDLFLVDPKSTSGGVFPLAFLKRQGIPAYDKDIVDRQGNHVTYTGTHDNCLKAIARSGPGQAGADDGRLRVGFVWEGALKNAQASGLPVERVGLEGLEDIRIPESAVAVRMGFYEQNRDLLDKLYARPDFRRLPEHAAKYDRIRRWREEFSPEPPSASERTDWPNFFRQLEKYMQEHKESPRLALVLAGGGAKCAFQVGVIRAIEQEISKYREQSLPKFLQENNLAGRDLDIALVVGTSGGAINALPVALGTYRSEAGVQAIRSVWKSLDARDILQPEFAVRLSIGILLALLHVLAVLLLVRVHWGGWSLVAPPNRGRVVARLFLVLGGGQLLWGLSGWKLPWDGLYYISSGLFVAWAVAASATVIVGALLLAVALVVGGCDGWLRRRGGSLSLSPSRARETIAWLTLFILVASVPIALYAASYLSHSQGLEGRIAEAAERLIDERLASRGKSASGTRDLMQLSRLVFDQGLLERDLIITATILPERPDESSETDVYFYASHGAKVASLLEDTRVQYLNESPRRGALLHAVLGSGAVFPVFPARTVADCPSLGQRLQLVDGSFCHHNPIEAADMWGATHVIVVNPSPLVKEDAARPREYDERSLYENSQVALQHLFRQAQNVDRRAGLDMTVFFINPDADKHSISLLSFARKPIEDAIDHAEAELDRKQKPFRRRLGRPVFLPELDTLHATISGE